MGILDFITHCIFDDGEALEFRHKFHGLYPSEINRFNPFDIMKLDEVMYLFGKAFVIQLYLEVRYPLSKLFSECSKDLEMLIETFREKVSEASANFSRNILNKLLRKVHDFFAKFLGLLKKRWKNDWEKYTKLYLYSLVVSTLLYQYLLGQGLKWSTRTYSSESLDFRDTFVSVLLFRGSYVWIKFREVAPRRRVYRRSRKDEAGGVSYYGKYEPRFKPPREKRPLGTSLKLDHLPLGGCDSHRDAEIVCQIAAFYYGKDEARIEIGDGSYFIIPPMPEQEQTLSGLDKVHWVAARAKEVFKDVQQYMKDPTILPSANVGVHGYSQPEEFEKFSLDAVWDDADAHPVEFQVADCFCAFGEDLLEGFKTSFSESELPRRFDEDGGFMSKQERSSQELKEQLEVEFKRRISEQHEQHLQREKQLEERISQLEQEIELLRSLLQH